MSSELEAKLEKMHEVPREQRNVVRGRKTQQRAVVLFSTVSQLGDTVDGSQGGTFFGKLNISRIHPRFPSN